MTQEIPERGRFDGEEPTKRPRQGRFDDNATEAEPGTRPEPGEFDDTGADRADS